MTRRRRRLSGDEINGMSEGGEGGSRIRPRERGSLGRTLPAVALVAMGGGVACLMVTQGDGTRASSPRTPRRPALPPSSPSSGRENIVFPEDAGLVDVTKPPYGLKGDGRTDNTAALRRAFIENRGTGRTLYFPDGTYLLSDRVSISGDEPSRAHSPDRFLHIQGQSQEGAVIRLRDNSPGYDDPEKPKTFISLYEGQSTGDVMHSYVRNITVEIGAGNPGAAALRYLTNNTGAMYDVTVRSLDPERRGAIGLDLRQSQNGPGLIKRVTVDGFDHGIETANTFSLVFEHIAVTNQRKAGFMAGNSRLTIRDLRSRNGVPALVGSKHTHLTLVEAELVGDGSHEAAMVLASKKVFVRDVEVSGYAHTIRTRDGEFVDGPLEEWYEGKAHSLFGAEPRTLRLPIEETPEIPWEQDLSKWVNVRDFGDFEKVSGRPPELPPEPDLERVDGGIDFDWGRGGPGEGIGEDHWIVQWTGELSVPRDGEYTFYTRTDDGACLWVDGRRLVDDWDTHAPTEKSGLIELEARRRYPIRMMYFEAGGGAVAQLLWSGPGVAKEIIPAGRLYSVAGAAEPGGLTGRYYNKKVEDKSEVKADTGLALQRAIDKAAREGATTIYLPCAGRNDYVVRTPVRVHGSVNRIIGMERIVRIDGDSGHLGPGSVVFIFEDLDGPIVVERFFNFLKYGGWHGLRDRYLFENRSDQTVVIRNIAHGACMLKKPHPGQTWFIEDVATHLRVGRGEKVWARQMNPESPERNMVEVDGGELWVLGMKTEGRATHIVARNDAKVELLGGVSYQSWKRQPLDPPMFIVSGGSVASFTFGYYHWNLPFTTIVQETVGNETRTLSRKELANYHLPVYRAGGGD
jgi:hypothetical protein